MDSQSKTSSSPSTEGPLPVDEVEEELAVGEQTRNKQSDYSNLLCNLNHYALVEINAGRLK